MKKPLAAAVLAIDLLVAQTLGAQGDASARNAPFLDGKNLGDTWRHPAAGGAGSSARLVAVHKLAQWLAY